ncbi:MAG: hypothetical protein AAFR99_15585 [Cyanobacteria bacterium J06629_9]
MANTQANAVTASVMMAQQQKLDAFKHEFGNRLASADRTLRTPDPQNYSGTANREYQKELARNLRKGGHAAATHQTDQRIAAKLKTAGFSRTDIQTAVQKHSPMAVRSAQQHSQAYAARIAETPAMKRQGIHAAGERRLDKVGLEAKTGLTAKQDEKVSEWKQAQDTFSKGQQQQPSQSEAFKVMKAEQVDKHGVGYAAHVDADQETARDMIKGFDSQPQDKAFHKAIGHNSATAVINDSPETQQQYGKTVAAIEQKRDFDEQPNQRPERSRTVTHQNRDVSSSASPDKQQTQQEQQAAAYIHHHGSSR